MREAVHIGLHIAAALGVQNLNGLVLHPSVPFFDQSLSVELPVLLRDSGPRKFLLQGFLVLA
jgi:hypothetical protein